ncbi:MAG TPA: hypothetical protein VMB50_05590, partial [Myxococcales bacterium]|nr:hypothetical protein [Myxococcales bacterium]
MKTLALLAVACGLACAPRNPESPLPPAAEQASPAAATGADPDAFEAVHPHTEDLREVPRIGAIRGRIVAVEGDKLAVRGRALAGDRADVSMFVGPV